MAGRDPEIVDGAVHVVLRTDTGIEHDHPIDLPALAHVPMTRISSLIAIFSFIAAPRPNAF